MGLGEHVPPLIQVAGHWVGHREQKNSKQETDQSVLPITKALTETTNCTCREPEKWRGTTKKVPVVYQTRSYIGTGGSCPQMDALPPSPSKKSHFQFFLHINFPSPVSLDAQMQVIT